MGAIGCWRCSRLMDEQSFHHHQATRGHHRFESRHDLRLSGSCSDEDRSVRLERIGYAYRRLAIAPFGPLPRKREGAFFDYQIPAQGVVPWTEYLLPYKFEKD